MEQSRARGEQLIVRTRNPFVFVTLPLAAVGILLVGPSGLAGQEAWIIEHLLGTEPVPMYRNLELRIDAKEGIRIRGRGLQEVRIPRQSIVALSYDTVPQIPMEPVYPAKLDSEERDALGAG